MGARRAQSRVTWTDRRSTARAPLTPARGTRLRTGQGAVRTPQVRTPTCWPHHPGWRSMCRTVVRDPRAVVYSWLRGRGDAVPRYPANARGALPRAQMGGLEPVDRDVRPAPSDHVPAARLRGVRRRSPQRAGDDRRRAQARRHRLPLSGPDARIAPRQQPHSGRQWLSVSRWAAPIRQDDE